MDYIVRLLTLIGTTVVVLHAAEDISVCPNFLQRMKFVHVSPDSCTLFISAKKDWTDAHKTCRNLGGELVMIKSAEKQQFILNKLRDDHWPTDGIWIGATDQNKEGDWRWVDGSRLAYSHFKSGQGNNHNGGFLFVSGSNEDCALLRRDDGGLWHDYRCSTTLNLPGFSANYPFACEFAKVARQQTTHIPITSGSTMPTPSPSTVEPLVTNPPTTMGRVETPMPTTQAKVETPMPTTQAMVETPMPTTQAMVETPMPTTQAMVETPMPTTQAMVETPKPTHVHTTHPRKTTTAGSIIIGKRK